MQSNINDETCHNKWNGGKLHGNISRNGYGNAIIGRYVVRSNVSIIFYCSMLLYYLFWMLMGFILQFYIIFGTNLLTQGPVQIAVFCLFQCFAEKEYQTESKRNETFGSVIFGTNVIQRTWSGRQETNEESMRQGACLLPWAHPPPCGPLMAQPTYFFLLYILIYPENIRSTTKPYFHRRNLLYPWDPILGPFPELRQRGHRSWRASTSTPWPLRWCVSSLIHTFGSILIS